jgi:hypothetical protein
VKAWAATSLYVAPSIVRYVECKFLGWFCIVSIERFFSENLPWKLTACWWCLNDHIFITLPTQTTNWVCTLSSEVNILVISKDAWKIVRGAKRRTCHKNMGYLLDPGQLIKFDFGSGDKFGKHWPSPILQHF